MCGTYQDIKDLSDLNSKPRTPGKYQGFVF